ncbi:MAG: thioesterase family protein [Planctomycetaceae bacterium]
MPKISIDDVKPLPITATRAIPRDWLDDMGHMNVMWYTHLFSNATVGLFELFGMTRDYFISQQAGSFALEAHVRYLAEVHAGQSVTLRSRLLGRSAKRFHFMHFLVIDDGGVLSSTGEMMGTHVDLRIRRTSPFPPEIAAQYDAILAEHQALPWDAPLCGVMSA